MTKTLPISILIAIPTVAVLTLKEKEDLFYGNAAKFLGLIAEKSRATTRGRP